MAHITPNCGNIHKTYVAEARSHGHPFKTAGLPANPNWQEVEYPWLLGVSDERVDYQYLDGVRNYIIMITMYVYHLFIC